MIFSPRILKIELTYLLLSNIYFKGLYSENNVNNVNNGIVTFHQIIKLCIVLIAPVQKSMIEKLAFQLFNYWYFKLVVFFIVLLLILKLLIMIVNDLLLFSVILLTLINFSSL